MPIYSWDGEVPDPDELVTLTARQVNELSKIVETFHYDRCSSNEQCDHEELMALLDSKIASR